MKLDADRRKRLTAAMAHAGLDAVVCCAASDVLLLTGYWPVMAMSLAVLTADGSCAIVLPEDEQELAGQYTSDKQFSFQPETLTCLEPLPRTLQAPLAAALKHVGLSSGRIGLREEVTEQPSSYVVACNFHQTMRNLMNDVAPAAALRRCDEVLEDQKDAKTAHELKKMALAAEINRAGFEAAPAAIQAGLTEMEVISHIQAAFEAAPRAKAVQRSYGSFYCMSGPNSALASAAYARTRERRLEQGDLVMIHANTCADGFWTDVTRTYSVGDPSSRHRDMRDAIAQARQAALARISPGVHAKDVDEAARSVMDAHGFKHAFKHPTGHGVGFAAANGAGKPRIHPLSPDVLQQGSTFNIEPAAYFDGYGGMRHCDVVAATAKGAHVLTDFQQAGM